MSFLKNKFENFHEHFFNEVKSLDDRERIKFELYIIASQFLVTSIYFALGSLLCVPIDFPTLAIFILVQLLFFAAYYLKMGTKYIIFGICLFTLIGISILAFGSGGLKSSIFPWYAPVLMLSIMLTRYQKKHIWLSGLVMLAVCVFSALAYLGYEFPAYAQYINTKELDYINIILVFVYIFIVSFYYEKMLSNLNNKRNKIINALSHDLKTPLSVIMMTSQILKTKMSKDPIEVSLEKIDRIERACDSLLKEIKKLRDQ